jgi:hypothetical protein
VRSESSVLRELLEQERSSESWEKRQLIKIARTTPVRCHCGSEFCTAIREVLEKYPDEFQLKAVQPKTTDTQ